MVSFTFHKKMFCSAIFRVCCCCFSTTLQFPTIKVSQPPLTKLVFVNLRLPTLRFYVFTNVNSEEVFFGFFSHLVNLSLNMHTSQKFGNTCSWVFVTDMLTSKVWITALKSILQMGSFLHICSRRSSWRCSCGLSSGQRSGRCWTGGCTGANSLRPLCGWHFPHDADQWSLKHARTQEQKYACSIALNTTV